MTVSSSSETLKESEETLPVQSPSSSDNGRSFLHVEAAVCVLPVSDILRVDFVLRTAQLGGRLC